MEDLFKKSLIARQNIVNNNIEKGMNISRGLMNAIKISKSGKEIKEKLSLMIEMERNSLELHKSSCIEYRTQIGSSPNSGKIPYFARGYQVVTMPYYERVYDKNVEKTSDYTISPHDFKEDKKEEGNVLLLEKYNECCDKANRCIVSISILETIMNGIADKTKYSLDVETANKMGF